VPSTNELSRKVAEEENFIKVGGERDLNIVPILKSITPTLKKM